MDFNAVLISRWKNTEGTLKKKKRSTEAISFIAQ